VSAELLREVPESAACGSTAEVYRDIRRVLEVPFVNLVYRHLATFPGLLEEAWWRDLRLNLKSAVVTGLTLEPDATAGSVGVIPVPTAALSAIGVDENEHRRACATFDVYNRTNTRNLVAVLALLDGAAGTGHDPGESRRLCPVDSIMPLPMVDLSRLDASVLDLLSEMGTAIAGTGAGVFVPSLLRHFGHRPALLALFWTILRPVVERGSVEEAGRRIASQVRDVVDELPFPVSAIRHAEGRAGLERFTAAIPRMIVVATLLRRSLTQEADQVR
jgi:hypothetical protein